MSMNILQIFIMSIENSVQSNNIFAVAEWLYW